MNIEVDVTVVVDGAVVVAAVVGVVLRCLRLEGFVFWQAQDLVSSVLWLYYCYWFVMEMVVFVGCLMRVNSTKKNDVINSLI